jgi:hypothetical protein
MTGAPRISVGVLLITAASVVTLGLIAAVLSRRERDSFAQTPATVVYAPAPTPVAQYFMPEPPIAPLPADPVVNIRFKTEEIDHMQEELDEDFENGITKISVSPKASMKPLDLSPPDDPTLSGLLEPRGHIHAMPRGRTPRGTDPEPTSPFRLETRDDQSVITSAPRPSPRRY